MSVNPSISSQMASMPGPACQLELVFSPVVRVESQTCRRLNNFSFPIRSHWLSGWGAISSDTCRRAPECISCATRATRFCEWFRTQLPADLHPFEKATVEADLKFVTDGLLLARGIHKNVAGVQ